MSAGNRCSPDDCRQQFLVSSNAAVAMCDLAESGSVDNPQAKIVYDSLTKAALYHLGHALKSLCLQYASDSFRAELMNAVDLNVCVEALSAAEFQNTELSLLLKHLDTAGLPTFLRLYQQLFAVPQNLINRYKLTAQQPQLIAVEGVTKTQALDVRFCRYWAEQFFEAEQIAGSLGVEF